MPVILRRRKIPEEPHRERLMQYKPKSVDALRIVLGGLPGSMRVEVDSKLGVSAKSVGELRKATYWPENLVITTPQERYPGCAVRVSKAGFATRTSPKL
jgi:hypothetical protein